jgi:RNA polymerase II subunit A C-terminal domain phosphatase
LVVPTSKSRTHKVRQAAKYPNIKIVTYQWLADSISKWQKQDETQYLVSSNRSQNIATDIHMRQVELYGQEQQHNGTSSVSSSIHDSDESDDETETLGDDDEPESVPASQEDEQDDEGVMPEEFEGGHSPIDDLKTFDWGGADEELAEFMGSDSDNDSDTGSVASNASGHSQTSNNSLRGVKRNHDETTDEEDSDEGSELVKRQRISSSRTTGLKTVNTNAKAASESSLPTPGPTGGEDEGGDGEDDGADNAEDDLEADLMAAFEMDEQEAADADTGG